MTQNHDAPVAVVTGASRGAGKGIARALGAAGMTVYVTGRSQNEGDAPLPGTIHETAREIDALGGRGIAVVCDHADDAQVKALFERVERESGRLDILVNNATYLHDQLILPGPFWEKSLWALPTVPASCSRSIQRPGRSFIRKMANQDSTAASTLSR